MKFQIPNSKFQFSKGQTLIEVIVAIGLVVLVLLTLVSALTLAVRNNTFAKDQVLARNRSREVLEWLRSTRDQMGWDAFISMINVDSPPVDYCLSTLPADIDATKAMSNQACSSSAVIPGTKYVRDLILNVVSDSEVDAQVIVSWTDGGKLHQSESTLILRQAL